MKKCLIASFAAAAFCGAPALAADLPTKAPAYSPAPAPFSWSGFYDGVNAGWVGSANNNVSVTGTNGFDVAVASGAFPNPLPLRYDGFIVGGQVGYNLQAGNWVYGLETDIQWSGAKDNFSTLTQVTGFVPITTSASRELDWFGTFRGRLGVAMDRTLLYVTGGLAYGETKLALGAIALAAAPPLNVTSASSQTSAGWTLGGGMEWAFQNNWSVKIEYLYVDLGKSTTTFSYTSIGGTQTLTAHSQNTDNIVRVGVNLKFGDSWGKAPVVARY